MYLIYRNILIYGFGLGCRGVVWVVSVLLVLLGVDGSFIGCCMNVLKLYERWEEGEGVDG